MNKETLKKARMALAVEEAYAENEIRQAVVDHLSANPVVYKDCKILPRVEENDRDDIEFATAEGIAVQIHFSGISNSKLEVTCPELELGFVIPNPVKVKILYTDSAGKQKKKVFS